MNITKAIELIMKFEGFREKPYKCSAGVPTIGYGTTVYPDGKAVAMSDKPVTKEQAIIYLHNHVQKSITARLDKALKDLNFNANENQYCALVSFSYNLGIGIITRGSSSLALALVKGDVDDIVKAILMYDKAAGKQVEGLTRRRQAEAELFKS